MLLDLILIYLLAGVINFLFSRDKINYICKTYEKKRIENNLPPHGQLFYLVSCVCIIILWPMFIGVGSSYSKQELCVKIEQWIKKDKDKQ